MAVISKAGTISSSRVAFAVGRLDATVYIRVEKYIATHSTCDTVIAVEPDRKEVSGLATRDAVSDLIRGNIDAIILCTLSSGDSYGYEILKEIATASQGEYEMKEPSLYTSLKRLEKQACVESYWGDETQGARRKYYRITEDGLNELDEATDRWVRVRRIIDRLLNVDGGES